MMGTLVAKGLNKMEDTEKQGLNISSISITTWKLYLLKQTLKQHSL